LGTAGKRTGTSRGNAKKKREEEEKLADELQQEQEKSNREMEQHLRDRRRAVIEEGNEAQKALDEQRRGEFHLPGTSNVESAGLLTGVRERSANPLVNLAQKQLSAAERTAKATEEMMRQRRQEQLAIGGAI